MIDKALVVCVTRDNPILLQNTFSSFKKFDPGFPCDFLIVDHESTDIKQLALLKSLSAQGKVVSYPNNRVEVSFDRAYREHPDYAYYFFIHDDASANKNNWLKVFVDRLNSGYVEPLIANTHMAKFPIGRVGASHQPWRSYSSMLGYPVQCIFLERYLKFVDPSCVPEAFKFADPDRVLVSNECLKKSNGVPNLGQFDELKVSNPDRFKKICDVLDSALPYHDEGMVPKERHPPGQHWSKLTLLTEFLCSVEPLMNGFRTVGLEGDGFLEQIHGYDVPWGHNYVHHYGAPNMCQFAAKVLNTDPNEIKKSIKNNRILLLKMDDMVKKYFERK